MRKSYVKTKLGFDWKDIPKISAQHCPRKKVAAKRIIVKKGIKECLISFGSKLEETFKKFPLRL